MADLNERAGKALRELHALGAVKSPWLAGMRDTSGQRVVEDWLTPVWHDSTCGRWRTSSEVGYAVTMSDPDTNDPATLGCLLALAREAYNDTALHVGPWFATACVWAHLGDGPGYDGVGEGDTESEALVAALEARVAMLRGGE